MQAEEKTEPVLRAVTGLDRRRACEVVDLEEEEEEEETREEKEEEEEDWEQEEEWWWRCRVARARRSITNRILKGQERLGGGERRLK